MALSLKLKPELDPQYAPAALWNRAFREQVTASGAPVDIHIALLRPDATGSVFRTQILPSGGSNDARNLYYLERIFKFLLWQRGGNRAFIAGCDELAAKLAGVYSADGERSFDHDFFGNKVYLEPLRVVPCGAADLPKPREQTLSLGRHLEGCRIGFDLGGSDRKCAAVIDGEAVFSEEVEWDPYFQDDPEYHIAGINDSLRRAADHLPRVDAIGGSAAGIYVNNETRVASLFRGVSPSDFETRVRRLFLDLRESWGNVPFEVVNDGEVTALAGSMSMQENAVLGIAMGTSQAVGYVTPDGKITPWLNELAFAPVDYRADAPSDEWSGDVGCGVQFFSQQAVARLTAPAHIELPAGMPFPEQLVEVQQLMTSGDERAARIYSTIGSYLGYAIPHYADFYEIRKILLLGRVTSGEGGSIIINKANEVLAAEFPGLAERIEIVTPSEKEKRHGQAVAAASLPSLGS